MILYVRAAWRVNEIGFPPKVLREGIGGQVLGIDAGYISIALLRMSTLCMFFLLIATSVSTMVVILLMVMILLLLYLSIMIDK